MQMGGRGLAVFSLREREVCGCARLYFPPTHSNPLTLPFPGHTKLASQARLLQLPLRLPQLLEEGIAAAASSNGQQASAVGGGRRGQATPQWPNSTATAALLQSLLGTMLRAGVPIDDCAGEQSLLRPVRVLCSTGC